MENGIVGLTGKCRVVLAETHRLINQIRNIIEDWDILKVNVGKDIVDLRKVPITGTNRTVVGQESNKVQGKHE